MNRRGFLGAILATAAAPAIIKASALMPIYVPRPEILTLWGDGIHDDAAALQAFVSGGVVNYMGKHIAGDGRVCMFPSGTFAIGSSIKAEPNQVLIGGDSHLVSRNDSVALIASAGGYVTGFCFSSEGYKGEPIRLYDRAAIRITRRVDSGFYWEPA